MSTEKERVVARMTPEDKERIKQRARLVGRSIGDYLAELSMWDAQFELVEKCRRGELHERLR